MINKRILWVLLAPALCALLLTPVQAQTTAATVLGTVTDAAGAIVPGVTVTLTNQDTGFIRETISDDRGDFEFAVVQAPNTYTLSAELPGFKKYVNVDNYLATRVIQRFDVKLQVGEVAEQVTVQSEVPVINTDTPQWSETRTDRLINAGPRGTMVMGRFGHGTRPLSLAFVNADVADSYKSNGSRTSMTQTSVDGTPMNGEQVGPPFSAIAEEKTVALNAAAEFRHPLTVDAVTKRGENRPHGMFTLNMRHPRLAALWPGPPGARRNPDAVWAFRYNFTGGGPIYIPKIYDGRDKSWLFISFEQNPPTNITFGQGTWLNTPTQAMRRGDLSAYLAKIRPELGELKDPLTGETFVGNIIPRSRWNPVAINMIDKWLLEPTGSNIGDPDIPEQNLQYIGSQQGANKQWVYRFDQSILNRNTFGIMHTQRDAWETCHCGGSTFFGQRHPATGQDWFGSLNDVINVFDTHIFTPGLINEFRFGLFRRDNYNRTEHSASLFIDSLGIDLGDDAATRKAFNTLPYIRVDNLHTIGTRSGATNETVTNYYSLRNNLSYRTGIHSWKLGYDHAIRQISDLRALRSVAGDWNHTGFFTGDPFADFLLGLPTQTGRHTPRPAVEGRYSEFGMFVQDDVQVSSRLKLNIGFRYDRISPRRDANGAWYNFNMATGALVVPEAGRGLIAPAFHPAIPIETADEARFPSHLINSLTKWSPRLGFAYRLDDKTVLRAGYGMFMHDAGSTNNYFATLLTGGPFALDESFRNTITDGVPLVTTDRPFPRATVGGSAPATFNIQGVNPEIKEPYLQQWNLTLERQLGRETSFRFAYVGSSATSLWYSRDVNIPPASLTPFTEERLNYPHNPGFDDIIYLDSGGHMSHHQFQWQFTRRMSRTPIGGLMFDGIFQWLKEIEDVDDTTAFASAYGRGIAPRLGGYAGIEDPYDRNRDRADAYLNPASIRINFIWELPWGPDQPYLSHLRKGSILSALVGGWEFAGIFDAGTGRPYHQYYSGFDPTNTGRFSGRASMSKAGCNPQVRPHSYTRPTTVNINCFKVPDPGTYGTTPRDAVSRLAGWAFDATFYKFLPIRMLHEDIRARLSVTFVNPFHHVVASRDRGLYVNRPARFGIPSRGGGLLRFGSAPRSANFQFQIVW